MQKPFIECPLIILGPGKYGRKFNPKDGHTLFKIPATVKTAYFFQCGIWPDPEATYAKIPGEYYPIRLN